MPDRYLDTVDEIESPLSVFAFRSRTAVGTSNPSLVESLAREWESTEGRARLEGRTPARLERDRVLFSDQFRKLTEKYHTLFAGNKRISRDYQSHSIRSAHVARAVTTRLGLNADLAEAIALATKVGCSPFVHVGKDTINRWVQAKVAVIDSNAPDREVGDNQLRFKIVESEGGGSQLSLPDWVETISSPSVRNQVEEYLPWCKGAPEIAFAYSSGQQSYWELNFNPFTFTPHRSEYMAQSMYGTWRHSLTTPTTQEFEHTVSLGERDFQITQEHATHEAVVVRYADDITWVVENLEEASRAAAYDMRETPYSQLATKSHELPTEVIVALSSSNAGELYTYFISDLVSTTRDNMKKAIPGTVSETEPLVCLSHRADSCLRVLKLFLQSKVFEHDRVFRRNATLQVLLSEALEALYVSPDTVIQEIEKIARKQRWHDVGELARAERLLSNRVHLLQVCVSLVSSMSDSEVYAFIGLD